MSRKRWQLSRRTVIRGFGTAMALPWLEAMAPSSATATAAASGAGAAAPARMAMLFFPNGAIMPDWTPAAEGAGFEMPYALQPLAPLKDDLMVLSGLTCDKARPNGDGAGDHARCSAAFLTASQPRKTDGSDIRVGVSVDQVAAERIGDQTRLPSLELATDPGRNVGNCDSGYSCAYSSNISWKTPTTPMAKEVNPRLVFERLFGSHEQRRKQKMRANRDLYKKSILDYVSQDAKKLQRTVGTGDRRKLDEYFSSVREIERRLDRAGKQAESDWNPDYKQPDGVPSDFGEHLRLMSDMMVLAFQGDVTRVSTLMFAQAGSNQSYRGVGVPQGHHALSHHGGDQSKIDQIRKIDRFHVEQFAYFVNRLKAVEEGDGNLLDNSMILYGSGIGDGNRHTHHDLPVVLAGRGGGSLSTGRHVKYPKNTPIANLYVDMLNRMGVEADQFGDSTGRLGKLEA